MLLQNWGNFVLLQIGATSFYYKSGQLNYYKMGQTLLQIWGSYYKLGQPLLQIGAAIKNWGKLYYKLGQLLQIGA